jgi:hypothetical protein
MSDKYPFIPDHLSRALEDLSIPLIDIMHGELKNLMLETEQAISNNDTEFTTEYLTGRLDALVSLYCLTYNLSIDRANLTPLSA